MLHTNAHPLSSDCGLAGMSGYKRLAAAQAGHKKTGKAQPTSTAAAAGRTNIISDCGVCRSRETHERPWLKFSEVTFLDNQGLSPLSSASFALKRQNSTPCDWFEKEWSLIFDISHSKASGSTVTFNRIFRSASDFLGIMYNPIAQQRINMHNVVCAIIANYAIGMSQNERNQTTSESYEANTGEGYRHRLQRLQGADRMHTDLLSVADGRGPPAGGDIDQYHHAAYNENGRSVLLREIMEAV